MKRIISSIQKTDVLYGLEEVNIDDEDIESLKQGKMLWFDVEGEYALVLKYEESR